VLKVWSFNTNGNKPLMTALNHLQKLRISQMMKSQAIRLIVFRKFKILMANLLRKSRLFKIKEGSMKLFIVLK